MEAEDYLITVWNNLENAQKSVVTKEKEYQEQKNNSLLKSQKNK